jgi:hypothetical protein
MDLVPWIQHRVQNTDRNVLVEHINCLVPPSMPGRLNIIGNEMMVVKDTRTIAVKTEI